MCYHNLEAVAELGVDFTMNIAELHKILHPKLKPYAGSGENYRHRLSSDMDVTISKAGLLKWVVEIHERGQVNSTQVFASELGACEEALKIAQSN